MEIMGFFGKSKKPEPPTPLPVANISVISEEETPAEDVELFDEDKTDEEISKEKIKAKEDAKFSTQPASISEEEFDNITDKAEEEIEDTFSTNETEEDQKINMLQAKLEEAKQLREEKLRQKAEADKAMKMTNKETEQEEQQSITLDENNLKVILQDFALRLVRLESYAFRRDN